MVLVMIHEEVKNVLAFLGCLDVIIGKHDPHQMRVTSAVPIGYDPTCGRFKNLSSKHEELRLVDLQILGLEYGLIEQSLASKGFVRSTHRS
jgi:hypothetical protein